MFRKFVIDDSVAFGEKPKIKYLTGEVEGNYFYPNTLPRDSYPSSMVFQTYGEAKKKLLHLQWFFVKDHLYSLLVVMLSLAYCMKNFLGALLSFRAPPLDRDALPVIKRFKQSETL